MASQRPNAGANAIRRYGSVKAIAAKLGVSEGTVQAWFGARTIPNAPSRALIAERLNIPAPSWDVAVPALCEIPGERTGAAGRAASQRARAKAAAPLVDGELPSDVRIEPVPGGYRITLLARNGGHLTYIRPGSRDDAERSATTMRKRSLHPGGEPRSVWGQSLERPRGQPSLQTFGITRGLDI